MHRLIIFLLLSSLITACIKENNPPTPAYIFIPEVGLAAGVPGTARAKIDDIWLTVNGQLEGINNPPMLNPVQLLGEQPVQIQGAVLRNGLRNERIIYPFYEPYALNVALEATKIDTLYPLFNYRPEAFVRTVENFENVGVVFGEDRDTDDTTKLRRTTSTVFEGAASGEILLDADHPLFDGATSIRYSDLQTGNSTRPVYLELHYLSDVVFTVGVIAHYAGGQQEARYLLNVNPKSTWNKIHVDLSGSTFQLGASEYSILIQARHNFARASSRVLLDNIQLLHF